MGCEKLHGVASFHSPKFHEIQTFLNNGIGAPMIQHGLQDTFGHSAENLYGFTPLGAAYVIDESEAAIREMYRLVFLEAPIERNF